MLQSRGEALKTANLRVFYFCGQIEEKRRRNAEASRLNALIFAPRSEMIESMSQEQAKQKIGELIEKYEEVLKSGEVKKYTEEETKKDFILPLFKALGWDVFNKKEVSAEEHIKSSGRVDYGFYINGRTKFYLEAKPLKADLNDEDFAKQAIRYSWNRGVTWAVLTNFESVKVFNAQAISKYLGDKLYFEIPYSEFLERFDQLWQLSRDEFEHDLIDKEAERVGKKLQKVSITSLLYKDLNEGREILTKGFTLWNKHLDKDLLDEGVQRLLDRLIFIRVAEDRGIEPPTLQPLLREWKASPRKEPFFKSLISKFRELDATYNSNLFSPHPFEDWEEYDNVTEEAIDTFYGKPGYYEYDFKAIPADVLGTVYENYLGYRLAQSKKKLAIAKDAKKRKEQGIYYTPNFIVDYIVKNALGPVLDKCRSIDDLKKIKVLDPACGSGSFLIKALEIIGDKYKEFNRPVDTYVKIQIITENLYGVDLDEQAVEIARLNLMINALDSRVKFPSLSNNIKNGNSLISGTDEELKKYFGKDYRDKKPFNWEEEFPEVFKQGGFDVVIGNPPWVTVTHKEIGQDMVGFFKEKYAGAEGFKLNLFPLFVELGIDLLKSNGIVSLIIPNRLFDTPSYKGVRAKFVNRYEILDIQNIPSGAFEEVVAGNIIITIQKTQNKNKYISISNFITKEITKLNIKDIEKDKNLTININSKPESSTSVVKIKKSGAIPLKEVCDIHVGMMVKNKDEKFSQQPIYKYPIVVGKDLARYFIKSKNYFNLDKVEIFGGTKNIKKHQEHPKLLVRKTGNIIICSLDSEGVFAEQSVYLVLLRNNDFDIKFLCAYLNSKLITFYFQNELITNPGAYPYIQHYDLEVVPVIKADKRVQKIFAGYTDKIIELSQKLLKISENSNEWQRIKDEIDKTDRKIDEEVYKLYGLTPGEIKIVEQKQ